MSIKIHNAIYAELTLLLDFAVAKGALNKTVFRRHHCPSITSETVVGGDLVLMREEGLGILVPVYHGRLVESGNSVVLEKQFFTKETFPSIARSSELLIGTRRSLDAIFGQSEQFRKLPRVVGQTVLAEISNLCDAIKEADELLGSTTAMGHDILEMGEFSTEMGIPSGYFRSQSEIVDLDKAGVKVREYLHIARKLMAQMTTTS